MKMRIDAEILKTIFNFQECIMIKKHNSDLEDTMQHKSHCILI